MINSINQNASIYSLPGISPSANNNTDPASSDFASSFKDILSTMMMSNGTSAMGEQPGSSVGDMMSPLLMIMLLEKLVELQMEEGSGTKNTLDEEILDQNSKQSPSGRPAGGVLTQGFHPTHMALDFGIATGTPIKSTMDGKVVYAGWNDQGYGNLVIVENGPYKTYYAHLSSIPVSVGEVITSGSTIGLSGNTGNSTGPHLHYEIRKNNVRIDPSSVTLGT